MQNNATLFSADYRKKAHLQKGFNPQLINDLVYYILAERPDAKIRPIKLLDLCCGDGGSTYLLLEELTKHGILVESLVGYDISPAQIDIAQSNYANQILHFEVKDINAIEEKNYFDVVLSLFGLHWIMDIQRVANKIQRCLKSDGLLMFFVPLEKTEFFNLRKELIVSEKWRDRFSGFQLHPFIVDPNDYSKVFTPFFTCKNEQGIVGEHMVEFERHRFADFLASWMQEVRHLTSQEAKSAFINDIIDGVISLRQEHPTVKTLDDGKLGFYEKFLWFHAQKTQATHLAQAVAIDQLSL